MFKKLFFIFLALFSPFYFVFANITFNEVMYDLKSGSDTGREWIEVYNDASSPVDLSTFKLFEADTNHKIVPVSGDGMLGAKSYAIIVEDPVKFKIDYPNISGNIFDSTFSLNNSGEILQLKDGGDLVVDEFKYNSGMGGAGDGNSLQKISGVWQGATPTPGAENKIIIIPPPVPTVPQVPVSNSKIQTENKILTTTQPPTTLVDQGREGGGNSVGGVVKQKNNSNYLFEIIFSIFVILSSSLVYFLRKQRIIPENLSQKGNDFEILEE